ncbi:MAG TPA: LysM domain-containing protein [Gaiellaceae bacterium]|nr:LysM domain-containing protein [Gaiellaceae bacterium]
MAVLLVRAGLQGGDTQTTTQTPTRQSPTSATSTTSTQRPHARYYRVVAGDTFGSISARVGISIARLQQLNPGVDSGALQVGQRLRVK